MLDRGLSIPYHIAFLYRRSLHEAGRGDVTDFLTHLAVDGGRKLALPKRRHSRARSRKRRSHDALRPVALSSCPRCNQAKEPHRVCSNCGYYKGRAVLAKKGA